MTAALARQPRRITVFSSPGDRARGWLRCGPLWLQCALGRNGVTHLKREGDGATPAGRHRLLTVLARRDRGPGPAAATPARALKRQDGWCDDSADGRYNRPIHLPDAAGHEALWRADGLYDIVGVLDWNLCPRIRRRGSAIFLHLCRPDLAPTAGCIALRPGDLRRLLAIAGGSPSFILAVKPRRIGRGASARRSRFSLSRVAPPTASA